MSTLTASEQRLLLEQLSSRAWRMENLYKIIDKDGQQQTFKMNPVQAELDAHLHFLNMVLKSRQHGITTYACLRALDMALFRPNAHCGIVAHTAFDAAKFFRQKVLYAYDNLPEWLRAGRPVVRRDMRDGVLELANGSIIEVSVSHRGGTLQFLHVSEYGVMCAKYPERAREVASGALNTVAPGNIVIMESTAYGATGDFYDRSRRAQEYAALVEAGTAVLTEMDYAFHFFGWHQDARNVTDPTYVPISEEMTAYFDKLEEELGVALSRGQRAWYVKKALEQAGNMGREHPSTPKEAFDASIEGAYYGKMMEQASAEGRIGSFPFRPGQPVHTFWDIGHRDSTAIWFMQENGGWFDFIGYYENSGEQAAYYATECQRRRDALGWAYGKHYLPHDIEVTEWVGLGDNRTRKQILEDLGVKPIVVVPRITQEAEGIDMVRRMLSRCRFDAVGCGPPKAGGDRRGGIDALKNFRKAFNEKTETWKDTPLEDWSNHGADAFRQFAQIWKSQRPTSDAKSANGAEESWRTS